MNKEQHDEAMRRYAAGQRALSNTELEEIAIRQAPLLRNVGWNETSASNAQNMMNHWSYEPWQVNIAPRRSWWRRIVDALKARA